MGKRNRGRERVRAPTSRYEDAERGTLVLRGSLSPLTRRKYTAIVHDQRRSTDDSWHRAVEFLFERLVERWTVHDVPTEGQKELLTRFRMATPDERSWIRTVLREHLAENFPDMEAP